MTENENQNGHQDGEVALLKDEVKVLKEEVEVLEELIDLEENMKQGKPPKKAKKYRIRIDKEKYVVDLHSMTGRQILALAGKTPETYMLSQKFRGGQVVPVEPDQVIEFHKHEVERFQTLALDPTEG